MIRITNRKSEMSNPTAGSSALAIPRSYINPLPASAHFDFIQRNAQGDLVEKGTSTPFRWLSFNIPALLLCEDRPQFQRGYPMCKNPDPNPVDWKDGYKLGTENGRRCIISPYGENAWEWVVPDPWEQEDAVRSIAGLGGRVIRTYTLGFGDHYHMEGPGKFNEKAFVAMDHALALCRKYGVRLVIPLVNQNSPNLYYGDYGIMTGFRKKSPSAFFTDPELINDFKGLIKFMLNRKNTVNGIRYGDDCTILAWQTGNELGGWEGAPPPSRWTIDIATYIKGLAPNTLVMDGTMGGLDFKKRIPIESLQSKYVDVFSNNYYYGRQDIQRLKDDPAHTRSYKKAFAVTEFGLADEGTLTDVATAISSNKLVSGGLLWSLRYHSVFSGFYTHFEKLNYWSYHIPGFPAAKGFMPEETNIVKMVRNLALPLAGRSTKEPYPCPPTPGAIRGVTPLTLKWKGSTWAARYSVARCKCSTPIPPPETVWETLSWSVKDNVEWGKTIYSDKTAVKGVLYCYKIQAISVDGFVCGKDALIIGPIKNS
ncbi:hypothetical protein QVD99_003547 [Batrachochytrium dendrobatidis]|nr:hypothetical protein O5D80_001918 [Batrachochytrium dendrobatidis]KAK5669136.1 hypothetical protein QVD99_003547 [Batrachochytrium dendrobatidis]